MKRRRGAVPVLILLALALALLGCGAQFSGDMPASTMTEAQRDSAIARSEIPGSRAVNRAFKASAREADLQARLDSIP